MSNSAEIEYKKIEITVGLDASNLPISIDWNASEMPNQTQASKAMLLSFFDRDTRDTLRIDLWARDMQVIEMDRFMYQSLRGLAETYLRATNNKELANHFRQFVEYFGQQTEIIAPNS